MRPEEHYLPENDPAAFLQTQEEMSYSVRWFCPFCGSEKPPAYEPATWMCCGEVWRAESVEIDEDEPDQFEGDK